MGFGMDMNWDVGDTCASVADTIHEGVSFANDRVATAWGAWKDENDAADSCGDFVEGQMYKVFCDMHCIEDAVMKGNSAVLKSMKTLETHIIATVKDMLEFHTTQIFDKLRETQALVTHGDRQIHNTLTSYAGQIIETVNDKSQQIVDKTTEDINVVLGALKTSVKDPLDELQRKLIVIDS